MELTLQAEPRVQTGSGAAHKLRAAGSIPAVVYSKAGVEHLQLSLRETDRLINHAGTSRLVNLVVKRGKKTEKTPVLIKEVQRSPVGGQIIHVDFHAVALDKAITTHVPVHLAGEEKRLNDGAIIEHHLREVAVSCLPTEIPEAITVDVSGLKIGEAIHVRDLAVPSGVKIITPGDEIVTAASAPAAVAEPVPAEAGEAQPEPAAEKEEEAQ